jgi:imidazolonepropionase-like amidohydrolase
MKITKVPGIAAAAALALGVHTSAGGEAGLRCAPGVPVLFRNVMLLTMESETQPRQATVLVRDGKIGALNPSPDAQLALGADVCRLDAAGAVLMPGLSDMHVHTSEREMPLFLANGVTFVREMNGSATHLALRDRIARGDVAGPSMLVASPLLVGSPLQYRHIVVPTPDDARRVARELKAAGYDFIKIYDGLSRPVYDAFVQEGRTLGMRLDGHIPESVSLETAVGAGQLFQHMDKIAFALARHTMDTSRYADARRLFSGRRVWVTPTLASLRVLDGAGTAEYNSWFNRPEMVYVDSASLGWWRTLSGTRTRTLPSQQFRYLTGLLRVLRESGARFLLGTDAANPMMIAGFSVHEELAVLVRDGGFSNYEVLNMATRNVGEFLGDSLRGRIAVGAPADLILVTRNPMDDLAALRAPIGVMARGRWFARAELDSMLADARMR